MLKKFFNKKTVIITGHRGFKGSWLSLWLSILGAKVVGLSIDTPSSPSLFNALNLKNAFKILKRDYHIVNSKFITESEVSNG